MPEISHVLAPGRVRGTLTVGADGQVFLYDYQNKKRHYTLKEYAQWAGMVCDAKVEVEPTTDESVYGWAYRVFALNEGDGKAYELPMA